MRSVTVSASKQYDALVGSGLLTYAGEKIAGVCGGETAAIVSDDVVSELYGDIVERSIKTAGYTTVRFTFRHGEQSKNMETYVSLLNTLTEAGLTRSDVLVALGGGVTGDLTGFAAATFLRGIRFVQIPTTVLAMVDSSVGGKTAVNLPAGKNQAGAFYQPDLVLCDIDTLQTLPEDVFADGCAEMLKHGVILSAELFKLLKDPLMPQLEDIIVRNITIKRNIVIADELDKGVRQILNFGHTIGHGIEKHSGYGVTHGRAVAIGMALTARGASRAGVCEEGCYTEIVEALRHYGLPFETTIDPQCLVKAAFTDKKRSGSNITLILPEEIGKCVMKTYTLDEAADFIRLAIRE